jgi:creatinine amidohydrolase
MSERNQLKSVWLQENKWPAIREYLEKDNRILIPIGSIEQHGRHLPLGTDSFIALKLAEDAAKREQVLISPPIWFGWSPHHMVLPGTISISPEVLSNLLFEVIKSLKEHGFKQFVVINGHRLVNIPWMQLAAERAQRELGVKVCIFDPAYMSKEIVDKLGFGSVGHAEEIETSHMLFLLPKLVEMEKAKDFEPVEKDLYHVDPRIRRDTLNYVPSTVEEMKQVMAQSGGVSGRPTRATKGKGREYHEHLVKRLVAVLKGLKQ